MNAPTRPLHLLAKPTGAICNLDCKYCFFLSKESLYPNQQTRMSHETLDSYIRQLLEPQDASEVTIAWQGGEPTLMGLEFFKRSIEIVARYQRPGQQILHTLQPMACCWMTSGASSSRNMGFSSASALTVRARCTMRIV